MQTTSFRPEVQALLAALAADSREVLTLDSRDWTQEELDAVYEAEERWSERG